MMGSNNHIITNRASALSDVRGIKEACRVHAWAASVTRRRTLSHIWTCSSTLLSHTHTHTLAVTHECLFKCQDEGSASVPVLPSQVKGLVIWLGRAWKCCLALDGSVVIAIMQHMAWNQHRVHEWMCNRRISAEAAVTPDAAVSLYKHSQT